MRYENYIVFLSFIQFVAQFVAELMNFDAYKIFSYGVISSYFTLLSILLSQRGTVSLDAPVSGLVVRKTWAGLHCLGWARLFGLGSNGNGSTLGEKQIKVNTQPSLTW